MPFPPRVGALIAAVATAAALAVPPSPAFADPEPGGSDTSAVSAESADASAASAEHSAVWSKRPQTVVLDGRRLALTRLGVHAIPDLRRQLKTLTAQADGWLTKGPWSVTHKPQLPPSGDKHDYLSEAPYWWPSKPKTPDNPWGCPYIQKDGVRNPAIDEITDHEERGEMFNAVYTLTLAWYYTGKAAYAERAALDLRTWFIDPATRMNPSLNYTQFIPCRVTGRGIGIIDFSQQFTDILDATAILDLGAPSWTKADHDAMQSWNTDFLNWLLTSKNGIEEAAQKNNHGSFYDMQNAGLALAIGQPDLAKQIVEESKAKRLDPQLAADGTQPTEITRTRSWHYSTFNLVALTRLAAIGQHVGVDLWNYTTPQGGGLFKAVDYLLPAATGAAPWTLPELEFYRFAASDIVHAAADQGDHAARKAIGSLEAPPGGDLWLLRPAVEQLDAIG
ncbi:alginate lyase family protein [Planotetraspora sp. A-T 1434]|uniref:alginate lyase family protein n=1 Tax=Planotetraspora sp. A-T 1434 TaxID=2979219 RepID=UPI0021BE553C|nr:alginate lyase family protein [Planotetraspora sp. A-T 1434]MCT9934075.1 alginate lyase family protein [Planotetraspora sp. A-T 1434]